MFRFVCGFDVERGSFRFASFHGCVQLADDKQFFAWTVHGVEPHRDADAAKRGVGDDLLAVAALW